MSNTDGNNTKKGFGLMHAGMAVCCAVMLIPVAGFFIAVATCFYNRLDLQSSRFLARIICIYREGQARIICE